MSVSVLLADDHAMLREGLKSLLEDHPRITVVGEAADGREALSRAKELKPDVVLMDVNMPGMNGIEATRLLKETLPRTRVIGLSVYSERHYIKGMLRAGAAAYLVKSDGFRDLREVITGVCRGIFFLSTRARKSILNDMEHTAEKSGQYFDGCSSDHIRVMKLLQKHHHFREIAADLDLSEEEVETLYDEVIRAWVEN